MRKAVEPIIRRAGELMRNFQHPRVDAKGRHADFVTEADVAVQTLLIDELSKAFPAARFFAEEKDGNVLTPAFTFIIDPIDGTTNYFRRRRCSMISVGAVEDGRSVFAMLYAPDRDELYHAEPGQGAWCNGGRLRVSDMPLERAVIGLGTAPYYEELFDLTTRSLQALLPRIADVRRTGSACRELCDVARGVSDGHFEWLLQPWDYAAGTLLVEEAGGRCGSITGGPVTYDRGCPHLAASARIFDALQEILHKVQRNG